MNEAAIRKAAATLAALLIGTLPAGAAFGSNHVSGAFAGGGSQATPGGSVTDRRGGSYDPARSLYLPPATADPELAALRARSVALNKRYGLGTYASGAAVAAAAGAGPSQVQAGGFSWGDASVGASAGAGAMLVLAGAALVGVRWRRKPAI